MDYPCRTHRVRVPREWIDINGHMNSTHYGLVIYDAHARFTQMIGLGDDYVQRSRCGKAVLESHMIYEREVALGDELEVVSWLLAVDQKRLHFAHELCNLTLGHRAALSEQLDIHMDLVARKSAPMPQDTLQRLQDIVRGCRACPLPARLGSSIRVPPNDWMQ
jgi:acyl-CoA thioester hydrolase